DKPYSSRFVSPHTSVSAASNIAEKQVVALSPHTRERILLCHAVGMLRRKHAGSSCRSLVSAIFPLATGRCRVYPTAVIDTTCGHSGRSRPVVGGGHRKRDHLCR